MMHFVRKIEALSRVFVLKARHFPNHVFSCFTFPCAPSAVPRSTVKGKQNKISAKRNVAAFLEVI